MKIKSLILRNWYKLIYILITIIYIIFLKRHDKKLLAKNFANSIQLLKYDDYIAVKFFILALIIAICGCWLIIKTILNFKDKHSSFDDIIMGFVLIVIIIILLILLLNYITVPILRAILTVMAVVISGAYFICHY